MRPHRNSCTRTLGPLLVSEIGNTLSQVNGLARLETDCSRCKPTVMRPGTPYCLEPDIPYESSQVLIGHSHRGTDAEYATQALPNVRLSHGSSPSTTRK